MTPDGAALLVRLRAAAAELDVPPAVLASLDQARTMIEVGAAQLGRPMPWTEADLEFAAVVWALTAELGRAHGVEHAAELFGAALAYHPIGDSTS